jgi:hypothetical protein
VGATRTPDDRADAAGAGPTAQPDAVPLGQPPAQWGGAGVR